MLRAAARRVLVLLVACAAITSVCALVVGILLFDAPAGRSISVGLYLVGSFLLVAGFFVGNRGPARLRGGEEEAGAIGGMFGVGIGRRLRWATVEEREESISNSAVFVALGLALILLGVLVDNRVELV